MERDGAHPFQPYPIWTEESSAKRLGAIRKSYAGHVTARAGISPAIGMGREIAAALASLPRERFVRPPPWTVVSPGEHTVTVSNDPAVLYQDVLVPLGKGSGLNNGQPSLHALCLSALAPKKGESAVHVGAGTGYYTAVLAMLVGEAGRVDAYEIEADLAQQAGANLAEFPQVAVHGRSGAEGPLPACDVLYVNAAAAEPQAVWLDALKPEGRLLFPLEPEGEDGQMLLVTRRTDGSFPDSFSVSNSGSYADSYSDSYSDSHAGPYSGSYAARFLCGVQFVACAGAQNAQAARVLEAAFRKGNWSQVRRLFRNNQPDLSCWCAGEGWWLSTR